KHVLAVSAAIVFAVSHAEAQSPPPAANPVATAAPQQQNATPPAAAAPSAPAASTPAQPAQTTPTHPAEAAPPAQPAPPPPQLLPPEVDASINQMVGTMDSAEKTLATMSSVNSDLGHLRDEIDGV